MTSLHAVLSPGWPGAASSSHSPPLLLLHGLGSHEYDLPELMPLLGEAVEWASLRGPVEMEHGGASWFPLTSPVEPNLDAVDAAVADIWAWIDENLPPSSAVIPLGFSQGGYMAIELLRSRPERVPAVVVLSGLMAEEPRENDAALAVSRPPVFWGRGAEDTRIWPEAVSNLGDWLRDHASLVERVYSGLGHGVSDAEMRDVAGFLAAHVTGIRD